MKVDRSEALAAHRAGRTYYFCSAHCQDAFEADAEPAIPVHAHH
jgi:YHS domain-containing protein